MMLSAHPVRAFFIYAHSDRKIVHRLHARMVRDGVNTWMDTENLQPGQDWAYEIRRAILKCDVIIVCLSRAFNERRGYRHEELRLALRKASLLPRDEVFIVPVRLEKCVMPDSLRRLHRVDVFERGGYRILIRTLREKAESNC